MRKITSINSSWKFIQKNVNENEVLATKAKKVNIPHTWNNKDGQDGGSDYYRGSCWYYKKLGKIKKEEDEVIYLEFEGVHSIADVYFNDKLLTHHEGGFSTFRCRIDENLNDENIIKVKVDNSANDRVYPQWADFTFFGGIYRDVNLIRTNITHFDLDYYGSKGIKVTPKLNKKKWEVEVETYLVNGAGSKLIYTLKDNAGSTLFVGYSETPEFKFEIENPHLWNGVKDPYTYSLDVKLVREDLELDNVSVTFGLRTFKIDPEKGFFLNGESYPLRGVSLLVLSGRSFHNSTRLQD